jgi:Kef-type K+ transport system membrane component KefB
VPPVLSLVLLVATAHLLGWLAARAKQPPLLGHMLAGVVWGPLVLDRIQATSALGSVADVAVLAVVVAAGLEMRLRDLAPVFRAGGGLALVPAFLTPAVAGVALAWASGESPRAAVVVGLCTSVTALPVALRILGQAGLLQTRVAAVAISSALLGDVVVLVGLMLAGAGSRVSVPYAVVVFLVALAASDVAHRFEPVRRTKRILAVATDAVFGPLFLAYQGVHVAPDALPGPGFLAALIAVAIAFKLAGGYCTGLASGLSRHDARGVAVVVNARGLMEVVIAGIAYRAGLVSAPIFSALLIMGTVTTMLTPPLLARWQRASRPGSSQR